MATTADTSFLAVSIDFCGAAHVKQDIVDVSRDDRLLRRRMYDSYKRIVSGVDNALRESLLELPYFDASKLSLIRSIRDQLWYTYQLDAGRTQLDERATRELLGSLLDLAAAPHRLSFASKIEFDMPVKIYADIVSDFSPNLYGRSSDALGTPVVERRDVGGGIDGFFESSELCFPKLLTVGAALFDQSGYELQAATPNSGHLDLKILAAEEPTPDDGLEQYNGTIFAIPRYLGEPTQGPHDADYSVLHLFDLRCLGRFDVPSQFTNAYIHETHSYLAEKGLFSIVACP